MIKGKESFIIFSIIFGVILLAIYQTRAVLTPFVLAFIIAYLLNPLTDFLVRKLRVSRLIVSLFIIAVFFAALITTLLFVTPIIYSQFVALLDSMPQYLQQISQDFYPKIVTFAAKFGVTLDSDIFVLAQHWQLNDHIAEFLRQFVAELFSSTLGLINVLSLIFIMPVLIFYLLTDWKIMLEKIKNYLPKSYATDIQNLFKEVDQILSSYLHGQFNVCIILGLIYAICLSILGLDFGFLIGLVTGLLSFIPYVGMIFGFTAAIIVALFQWGFDATHLAFVTAIFLSGQLIEANFLTPKLIGKKINLHPMWVIFGLFFFGCLLGFVGVLLAVPLSAICGVLVRNLALKYKKHYT